MMKKFFAFAFAAIILTFSMNAAPQDKGPRRQLTDEQKTEIFNAKMKSLQEELGLSAEQVEKFAPLYKSYDDEMMKTHMRGQKPNRNDNASVNDVLKELDQRFDNDIKSIELRKSYMHKFSTVLNAKQLRKFNGAERKMMQKAMKHRQDRMKKGDKNGDKNGGKNRKDKKTK